MAMLLPTPVSRANPSFLATFPPSCPNSSSLLVNLRSNPKTYAQFPPSLANSRPAIFGKEKPQEPVFESAQLDDVESEAGTSDVGEANADESASSAIATSLQLYKEALQSNDETRLAEIEALFKSIEDAKDDLQKKVVSLSEELTVEKIRLLRISADFDNFRKSRETERLSLVTNAQGEFVESLLPVLDNFESAKTRIKVVTEGEEKINNSYQSIHKQFAEILASVDVASETVGNPFDSTVQNQVGLNPIDQLLGKMLRLLNRSFSGFR